MWCCLIELIIEAQRNKESTQVDSLFFFCKSVDNETALSYH